MQLKILALSLLCLNCLGYEEDDLRSALGGGLTEGLDDLMSSFGEAIDGLAEMAEGKTVECNYQCENGNKRKSRPDHKPTSNGCGSFGIEFDTASIPQMTACCDTHDFCYDTCNSEKEKCDKDFKKCLLKMCDKIKKDLNTEEYEGCKATAEIMYRGTLALGCTPYKKAQKNSCDCGNDKGLEHKKNKSGTKTSKDEQKTRNNDKSNKEKKSVIQDNKTKNKIKPQKSRESGDL